MEIALHKPSEFERWLGRLGSVGKARVLHLIEMLEAAPAPLAMPHGRALGGGLYELRSVATGHRVYYTVAAGTATILAHGTKDTQARDIERARGRLP